MGNYRGKYLGFWDNEKEEYTKMIEEIRKYLEMNGYEIEIKFTNSDILKLSVKNFYNSIKN